jgi:hypothetical protein
MKLTSMNQRPPRERRGGLPVQVPGLLVIGVCLAVLLAHVLNSVLAGSPGHRLCCGP